jgi:hypothetical protein
VRFLVFTAVDTERRCGVSSPSKAVKWRKRFPTFQGNITDHAATALNMRETIRFEMREISFDPGNNGEILRRCIAPANYNPV